MVTVENSQTTKIPLKTALKDILTISLLLGSAYQEECSREGGLYEKTIPIEHPSAAPTARHASPSARHAWRSAQETSQRHTEGQAGQTQVRARFVFFYWSRIE